jgi:SAM-dependent methyltransferase
VLQKVVATLPPSVARWIRRRAARLVARPPVGDVSFGDFMRVDPISPGFGLSRGGTPIDRFYIERFLARHASDISGVVLEVADSEYTERFGHDLRKIDVLHLREQAGVTVVADLCDPPELNWGGYDSIVLTQTLQFVPDPAVALRTVVHLLRSGGVLLATVPGISQISRYDADRWGDRWRFTRQSAVELGEAAFGVGNVSAESFGNVLAAVGVLHGLVVEDVPRPMLEIFDPDYEVIVALRGVKP